MSEDSHHTNSFKRHPLDQDFEFLTISCNNAGVVIVCLNRPHKRNAIHRPLWKEIGQVFSGRVACSACRCILLTANGPAFSAGIDVTDSSFMPDPSISDDVAHIGMSFLTELRDMQDCFSALEECPVPVVAAIQGNCIGTGVDLVCAADIRVCTENATFAVREVALGLAADVGTLQRLPKIVGNESWVRDICLTGRSVTAQEARDMGLVSRIYPNEQQMFKAAVNTCLTIAKHSPVAVRGTKNALIYARDHSVKESLDQIAAFNMLALQSQDLPTAWGARSAGVEPTFTDVPPLSRL